MDAIGININLLILQLTCFALVYLLPVLLSIKHILTRSDIDEKRRRIWMIVLIVMPLIAVPAYWLFGRNHHDSDNP